MAKAISLCLLDQQRQLTMYWGKDRGEEMGAVGRNILRKVKGNQKINAGHAQLSQGLGGELDGAGEAQEGVGGG
eukprot:15482312-Alexandrium_andersonii.AAC.1